MRNAPSQQFRPTQLDFFGNTRPERGSNVTSVARPARETTSSGTPVSQVATTNIPRGTTSSAPATRVQTVQAPQAKPAVTSTIKKPAVATKPVVTTKPAATKTPVAVKTPTTKTPVAAKTTTTKAPVTAKTTTTVAKTPTKPVTTTGTPITKPVSKPTNSITSTLKKAAVGAGTAALINNLVNKKTTAGSSVNNKQNNLPTMGGGQGLKLGAGNVGIQTNAPKLTPASKAATTSAATKGVTGASGTLTDEQIQAELDRVKAEQEANTVPEGAVTNEDGTYSVTQDGMTTTYAADGSIIGMEATTDTTGTDTSTDATSNMTDLGEGYFADADGNVYSSSGDLLYTVGADGEYVDANAVDANNDGSGNDTSVVDAPIVDDGTVDDYSNYVDDGTNYEEDADGGSIPSKRHFVTGGATSDGSDDGYSDTGEEVQPFQNLENSGVADVQNSDLNDNGDGTYSYFDGKEYVTIDDTGYELYRTDEQGQVVETEAAPVTKNRGVTTEGDDYGNTIITDADGNRTVYDPDGNILSEGDPNARYPVDAVTSTGSGRKKSFAALDANNQGDQKDQTGILNSLMSAVRNNPGLAGGAVGALIASLMDQGGGSSSTRQPVDISELTSFAPRTTDFGAGMVGGRTGTGSPLVSYADYAGDNGDEIIDDRLFSDLGVSGYLREPDMADYRDEDGNLTDQSGNLVDEYGYLLDDGNYEEEVPEEETAVEDTGEEEPTMASGGTTHYTFGRVMNPADNLGLGMKKGGLSQAHTVHSHHTNPVVNNRVDFRKGSAVNGAGDGQSDDIPAWLADGEYVMDAELVSMLGNGSNKAGAKVLDQFREDIRAHKRSAPLGKIPPKAKSPLNYLKESMNG
jgi:hypothetical protein